MIFLYWAHFNSVYYVNANFEFFVCLSFSICFFLFPLLSFSLPWLSFDTKHTRLYNRQTLEPIRTHPERHFIILSALAGFSWFLFFKDFSWTIRYEEPKKALGCLTKSFLGVPEWRRPTPGADGLIFVAARHTFMALQLLFGVFWWSSWENPLGITRKIRLSPLGLASTRSFTRWSKENSFNSTHS